MPILLHHVIAAATIAVTSLVTVLIAPSAQAQSVTLTSISDSLFSDVSTPQINESGTILFFGRPITGGYGIYTVSNGAITTITDNTSGLSPMIGKGLSINEAGAVAFYAQSGVGNNTRYSIFTSSGGSLTTIASTDPLFGEVSDFDSLMINDAGTVAFRGIIGPFTGRSGVRIYTGSGGALTTIAEFASPSQDDIFSTPHLRVNNAGTVVFHANNFHGGSGIYTGNGGAITTIADLSSMGYDYFSDLRINDAGTVAFSAGHINGNPETGIFTGNGTLLTTIADSNGDFSNVSRPSLNDAGNVAFLVNRIPEAGGGSGIYVGNGGTPALIADTNGPLFSDLRMPNGGGHTINNAGTVVFTSAMDAGGWGLFAAVAGVESPVTLMKRGDPFLGSTVDRFSFLPSGLNDKNQLAFTYRLEDNRIGVALATIVVPEANTFTLVFSSLVFSLGIIYLRRRASVK